MFRDFSSFLFSRMLSVDSSGCRFGSACIFILMPLVSPTEWCKPDRFFLAIHRRLLDLKQGQNKEGQTILYLVFEYMDTDLKKYIRSFRQVHEMIPPKAVKVRALSLEAAFLS